MKKEGKKHR